MEDAILIKYQQHSIRWNNSILQYFKTGTSPDTIIIFPGYGQGYLDFLKLTEALSPNYTCLVIHPFFYGQSLWAHGDKPIDTSEWLKVFDQLLKAHNLSRFSLLGYSLGAKFVLAVIQGFPQQINKIIFIAPDGIKHNLWYRLATGSRIMRFFFKGVVEHPLPLENLIEVLKKLNLADSKTLKFARYQMNTKDKRERVYHSWVVFRNLVGNKSDLIRQINEHSMKLIFLLGKYDTVIKPRPISSFAKKLDRYRLEIIETSHSGLINHPQTEQVILEELM